MQVPRGPVITTVRNDESGVLGKKLEGGPWEVIPVLMCQIDEIRLECARQFIRNRRIVPPRPPIAAAQKPRIAQQLDASGFHLQAGV
jgi:hypothetical protein